MRKTKIVPIIFSIEQYRWLKKESEEKLQSMSAIMRRLLEEEKKIRRYSKGK